MIPWIYRIALYAMTFGLSPITYGGNIDNPLLTLLMNLSPILSLLVFVATYFRQPGVYKIVGWALLLGTILLMLESKYEYGQFVYSYFVIKRFGYCAVALAAYYVAQRSEPLSIKLVVNLTFIFFFINQILMGRIFGYGFTSETRTTLSTDAFYLIFPFLYYLVSYLKDHKLWHLLVSLFTFLLIVALLHRTVISVAVVSAVSIFILTLLGKVSVNGVPTSRTALVFSLITLLSLPFTGLLPEKKVDAVLTSIGGIFTPKQDNTASWRMEQSDYYMKLVPERPLFGWRYDGYDRGEIMPDPDFPAKGTIIHSQYVDQLFNYGLFAILINMTLIVSALVVLYRAGPVLSIDHLVLFGYVVAGIFFGLSYQLPVNYWAFVGVSMYVGLNWKPIYFSAVQPVDTSDHDDPSDYSLAPTVTLLKNHADL